MSSNKNVRNPVGYDLLKLFAQSTYPTLASSLKEAVSNSYDAGATKVRLVFFPDAIATIEKPNDLLLSVQDNGFGMTRNDIETGFLSVGSKKKHGEIDKRTGRYPIGYFGIGSLALSKFAQKIIIYTRAQNSSALKCEINCAKLNEKKDDDYKEYVQSAYEIYDVSETDWEKISPDFSFGTLIFIQGVTASAHEELKNGIENFELDPRYMQNTALTKGQKQIAWTLSTLLPLNYAIDAGNVASTFSTFLKTHNPGIDITLSKTPLERNIFSDKNAMPLTFEHIDKKNGVKARGVIVCRKDGPVIPREANGVILRLNNVGIGSYKLFGAVGNATIRSRITGEIHILEGLEGSLNGARDGFQGPAYDELSKAINLRITEALNAGYAQWDAENKAADQRMRDELNDATNNFRITSSTAQSGRAGSASGARVVAKTLSTGSVGSTVSVTATATENAQSAVLETAGLGGQLSLVDAVNEPNEKSDSAPTTQEVIPQIDTNPSSDLSGISLQPQVGVSANPKLSSPRTKAKGGKATANVAQFTDPLTEDPTKPGTYHVNTKSKILKSFKGKQEKFALEIICRAMKLKGVSPKQYEEILEISRGLRDSIKKQTKQP